MIATADAVVERSVEIRGAVSRLFDERPMEVVISGPAGTGKTRSILEFFHWLCSTYRVRVLFLRKTLESLKGSALVTYQEQVLTDFDGRRSVLDGVTFYGGSHIRPAEFTYEATGSKIICGGMDKASKVLSTEYDAIYVNECSELRLDEWEILSGRSDRPSLDTTKQASILLGDCNPDVPTHWIRSRAADGSLELWTTTHEDNPAMWDAESQQWTAAGRRYMARLERLTGVRYKRLRLGLWVAAEGQIYESFDPSIHLIDRFVIPKEWPRYWVIDFGFVHPFVWQWWAIGNDGAAYLYRELYMTRRLVEDHAELGLRLSANEPRPVKVITDHDAEDRATFERKTKLRTTPANKNVSAGIQAVASRLKTLEHGRPRLYLLRDSLVERDQELKDAGEPTCTAEEFPSYIWDTNAGKRRGDAPVKERDHGMDATRYMVAELDLRERRGGRSVA